MKRTVCGVLLWFCWVLFPGEASACTCASNGEITSRSELTRQVRHELTEALAVFIGEPIGGNQLAVRLRVRSVWKGDLGQEVVMSSGAEPTSDGLISSSSCNFTFRAGEVYVIFAQGPTHTRMKARSCTFTSQVEHSQVLGVLDDISRRRPPSPSVMAARLVAVVGSVRSPGLVEWREGLIVADAISLAGGVIPPPRPEFARLTSSIVRGSMMPERLAATSAMPLLPDDELFVAGPIRVSAVTHR